MTKNQRAILIGLVAFIAIAGTAVGASYLTRESLKDEPVVTAQAPVVQHRVSHRAQQVNAVAPAAGKPACDDKNIVGTVIGGAAGGIAGNQIGKGTGKTVATLGGVAGGAYLGNQYINTRGATCN